ncbi:MAG: FHA domain-containing protein [Planctomycetota bacterium]|jgi:pSer/pThr/pTyr-binding forkhead associated (FHA) protein
MAHHVTMKEFHEKYGSLDKEAFVSRVKTPVLVVELDPKEQTDDSRFKTLDQPDGEERSTEQVSKKDGPFDVGEFLAVPLEKTDRNTFHNMITLGRSSNNDVVVPHASVSKLHAIFRVDPSTQRVSISDAGSSFGSLLNGKPLPQGVDTQLNSGDTIRLADSVKATFLATVDFYEYLHLYIRMPG